MHAEDLEVLTPAAHSYRNLSQFQGPGGPGILPVYLCGHLHIYTVLMHCQMTVTPPLGFQQCFSSVTGAQLLLVWRQTLRTGSLTNCTRCPVSTAGTLSPQRATAELFVTMLTFKISVTRGSEAQKNRNCLPHVLLLWLQEQNISPSSSPHTTSPAA